MPDGGLISGPLIAGHALYGGGLLGFLGTSIFGVTTVGAVLATTALSGTSYLLQKAAAKKALRNTGINAEAEKQIVKQALPLARMIYGTALVGGSLFFAERSGDWIYYGIILANHGVDGIEEYRMGEKRVLFDTSGAATTLPYFTGSNTYLYASFRPGTDDQTIDPLLAADFPALDSSFRQRGRATVVLKMFFPATITNELRTTLYGTGGQPTPLFKVRGKRVFDPRDPGQSHADPSTWQFRRSPTLCAADFQTLARKLGGGGAAWDEIDIEALKKAANDDDTPVPLKAGGTEPRYTCDGVVSLDGTAYSEVISKILTANAGFRVTSNGKYVFLSGVPRSPVWTLTDDSARGAMQYVAHAPLDRRVNIVKSSFASSEREYQVQEGPVLRNSTFITEDGMEMPLSLEFEFTSSHTMVQRLCSIAMRDSRNGRMIVRRENIEAILLDAADVVNVQTDVIPGMGGVYIMEDIGPSDTPMEFDVSMRGYDPAIYNWTPATDEQDFTIAPTDLS